MKPWEKIAREEIIRLFGPEGEYDSNNLIIKGVEKYIGAVNFCLRKGYDTLDAFPDAVLKSELKGGYAGCLKD